MEEDHRKQEEEGPPCTNCRRPRSRAYSATRRAAITTPLDIAHISNLRKLENVLHQNNGGKKKWSKPKKKKMQDPRNTECKSQKGKGHSQDQSRGRPPDNTARGCRPWNKLSRQNRGVQEQFLRNLLKLMHCLMRVILRKIILRGY